MAEHNEQETQVEEITTPAHVPAAGALAQNQSNVGSVDNSFGQQASKPVEAATQSVAAPISAENETELDRRIKEDSTIVLVNDDHAAQVVDGTVIVYTGRDSGMSLPGGITLDPYRQYLVPEEIPLEMAIQMVRNRTCAIQGSDCDPNVVSIS